MAVVDNRINNILKVKFRTLPLADKLIIKDLGRPTPLLNLTQQDKVASRNFTRHFSKDIYEKFSWIAGCDVLNALFCFPCVLFYADGMDKTWTISGFVDLKHLNARARKHAISGHHIHCCTELALLGSSNFAGELDSIYRQNIIKHNEQVSKNRYILKRIINCIKFCGKLELALRGHDGSETSEIFHELIDFPAELDVILKEHFSNAAVFKGTSKTVQNEVLESMLAVCREEIKNQINHSEFLAIQSDETTDISNHCQMVITLRYFDNGYIYERFWTFLRVPDKSAPGLAECIETELNNLISVSPDKLIAQTDDGANITSVAHGGIQATVKQQHKHAHFVHCYAHSINLIMQKVTGRNAKLRIFFSNLSAIPAFFSNSSHRCNIFEEIVNRKLPGLAATRWNYNKHTVNMVFDNRDKLIECLDELKESCTKTITCKEAYNLQKNLEDSDFVFWLNLFHKIFPHIDVLFNRFQSTDKDTMAFLKDLEEFEDNILSIRNSTEEIEQNIPENKRRRINPENNNCIIAKEVCVAIILQFKERLSYRGHLEAATLIDVNNFTEFSQNFPISTFKSVVGFYPMLQQDKLKTELEVIYSRSDIKNIVGCLNMLSWLSANDLSETFSETEKLLKIVVTTPMNTTESERCFSTLNRVKSFLRNTMNEDRLNALAMAAILQQTAEYIYSLEQEKTQLLSQNSQLKRLVSQHDSGELPPKKRKTEVILPISESSDEGLGSMSPEPINAIAVVSTAEALTTADLRRQLEHERSLRMVYEEQLRRLESQHIIYQQQTQLYQVEETEELNLQLVAPESLPPVGHTQTVGCSPPTSRSPSPVPTPEQRLPSVLEAAIKAEPKVEVERLPSPNNSHEDTTPARLYAANTSRQNLETIVEAIRHLEGDHMFGDEPQTQDAPLALTTRTDHHLLKVEMNPFLDFHGSSVQHQQQSRPGVIVVKQAS